MPNVIEIRVRATDETGPVYDKVKLDAAAAGRSSSAAYTSAFSSHVRGAGGQDMAASIVTGLEDAIPQDTLGPASSEGERIKENARKTGEQAGKAAGDGMSPMMTTAIIGGLAQGAPLVLGAFGGVMAGITALALKNNVVIKQDFADLGKTAGNALSQAAAPAAGTLNQALIGVEGTVKGLEPQLQGLFVNVEPDITAVAGGISAFASNVLPGMSDALKNSQVIVSDLGASLGGLGAGVGSMFQGLTRDAYTTGAGMESLLGTVGHLASTLGTVLGSAASVGSTALMGLDPVLNTTLSLVQKLADPGTVGAAAGLFAAFKLGGESGAITSGLSGMAKGLGSFAKDAEGSAGAVGALKSAAGGLSGVLEKGASVMSGPWGLALGAGIGLATGLAGAIINASHATDALTLSQQGLQQAIAQDQGVAGASTAAYIAQQDAANGLSDTAKSAGVSMGLWTQAVLGSSDAQNQVVAAVDKANRAQQQQKLTTDEAARSTGKFSGELQGAETVAQQNAVANNTLTDANQKLLNSMNAQTKQVADAIAKQSDYQKAMDAVTNSTTLFEASLTSSRNQMVASAQQSALNTTAALNLGDSQVILAQNIDDTLTAYSLATTGAQAYSSVLQALNGTTMGVDEAQNKLAQEMLTAEKSFKKNKYSLDLSTAAGVANRQALVNAAKAIQALGDAEEQKTGSIAAANKVMKDQETAFINATGATGDARKAIQAYIDEILKIPAQQTTTLTIIETQTYSGGNTGGGRGITGGPTASKYATGGVVSVPAAATGGSRGGVIQANEQGIELFRLQNGTTVIPHSNVESMVATGALSSAPAGPVQLELLPSGGSALEQMIWDWLRGRIRAKGGSGTDSVQRALGQVS